MEIFAVLHCQSKLKRSSLTKESATMRNRSTSLLAAAAMAGIAALTLTSCSIPGGSVSAPGGTQGAEDSESITIGVPADVTGREFDPHQTAGGPAVSTLFSLYETLYDLNTDGVPQPNLITEDQISEDGLTFTMTLQEGLTFHDGSVLDSEDVAFSINRARGADPSLESTTRMSSFAYVEDVVAPDPQTVVIEFTNPDPAIRNALSYFGGMVLPSDYVEEVGTEGFVAAPVGSGPYAFESASTGEVHLAAFADYPLEPAPAFQSVTLRVLEEGAARVAQLRSGDIDFAFDVDISQAASVESAGLTIISNPSGQNLVVALNSRQSLYDDPRVAQAMNMAVDQQAIVDTVYQGYGSVSSAMDPTVTTDEVAPIEYDPEAAEALLAESDYNGETLILNYPSGRYPQDQRLMQTVQANLAAIGMTVELRPMDSTQWLEGLQDRSLDDMTLTMLSNENFDPYPALTSSTSCDGPWSLYCNEDYDARLAEVGTLADEERRAAIVALSEGLREAPAAIFLLSFHQVYGMDASLTWTPSPNIRNFDFTDIRPVS